MRIALVGATGYGGSEALRLLRARTDIELVWVGSDRLAGRKVGDELPQFGTSHIGELRFSPLAELRLMQDIDIVLLALPHGEARIWAPQLLARGLRVIDFSGDYRLPDAMYAQWYGKELPEDRVAQSAVYGLPELYREEIRTASLVANPGCYATCAELALLPLVEAGLVDDSRLVIDAKSGVSGAGKAPSSGTHFVEVQESVRAYKVGAHQHTPEIEQVLADGRRRRRGQRANEGVGEEITTREVRVMLTTQLLPIKRGIYVTAYASLGTTMSGQELQEVYRERYDREPFVQVLQPGVIPEIRYTVGTNLCQIGVHVDQRTQTALVMATIDNLGKGAAGQALQNLNLMMGLPEDTGLRIEPWV
ncbi:MAG: N-acetyl-gamma-glutamyl-phosphate reductase [Firmicutes bacterium]|nr:N-acetyl-gamma-glutamyl-phosphate reductase [Bacillota bacterium]